MSCSSTCRCGYGMSNTGSGCTPLMKVTKKVIFVPQLDDDGNRNGITIGATLDQTYFDALVNQSDPSKRWFPLPEMKNVKDERADNIVETFEDGSTGFVQEGTREFMGWAVNAPQQLKGKIEAGRCIEMGVYLIDINGNLVGSLSEDRTTLYPIKIDKDSISAKFIKATDKTLQKIEFKFNFSIEEHDESLEMITCEELDYEVLNLRGLLDIYADYSLIDNTTFTMRLRTDYGTPTSPVLDKGLVAADLALYNVTDSLAVIVTSVTEDTDGGTYVVVFPAQTNADEIRVTPSRDGRDYSEVIASLVTMPLT